MVTTHTRLTLSAVADLTQQLLAQRTGQVSDQLRRVYGPRRKLLEDEAAALKFCFGRPGLIANGIFFSGWDEDEDGFMPEIALLLVLDHSDDLALDHMWLSDELEGRLGHEVLAYPKDSFVADQLVSSCPVLAPGHIFVVDRAPRVLRFQIQDILA